MIKDQIESQNQIKKALEIIEAFGYIPGNNHKTWVIDQILRALTGCPDIAVEGSYPNGEKYNHTKLGESEEYKKWVLDFNSEATDPWSNGIAYYIQDIKT
jgi:hypothetical protein